jgi:hypothetical protein
MKPLIRARWVGYKPDPKGDPQVLFEHWFVTCGDIQEVFAVPLGLTSAEVQQYIRDKVKDLRFVRNKMAAIQTP